MKIKVKTERYVEECSGIKQENQTVLIKKRNPSSSHIKSPSHDQCAQQCAEEKKKLVDACVAMKTENQKLTFNLKKKSDECVKLATGMKNLNEEVITKTENVKKLIFDLNQTKLEFAEEKRKYEQKISGLVHENKALIAREKQFKNEIVQNVHKDEAHLKNANKNSMDENNANVYEVAKLLDDKMIGKVRYFLVRWKGFTSKDDTWENESNLMCPSILSKYLQKKYSD